MDNYSRKRIYVIGGGFLFFVVLVVTVFIISSMQNKYGDSVGISNLNTYTAGKPSSNNMIDSTERNLLLTVNMNRKKPVTGGSIKGAIVRKESFSQKFASEHGVHTVKFIVDIPSLRQSYDVSYQWEDDGGTQYIAENGTGVTCLAIDKLIYGDFNCVDSLILEKGKENYDPVEKILPHTVQYKYDIKEYTTVPERGEVTLRVDAFVPAWLNKDDVLNGYTSEIKTWLSSKKLDPGKYNLDFVY
jgi:hypothetical protein